MTILRDIIVGAALGAVAMGATDTFGWEALASWNWWAVLTGLIVAFAVDKYRD